MSTQTLAAWAVIGDGAWSGALARRLATRGHAVDLVGLKPSKKKRPQGVRYTTDVSEVLTRVERVIIALPIEALLEGLRWMAPHLRGHHRIVLAMVGLTACGQRATEALTAETAVRQVAVLAGAARVKSLNKGKPSAMVVGSDFPRWATEVQTALKCATLRVYTSTDPVGVELAGTLSQVFAVAMGITRGLKAGPAAEATGCTRSVSEMERIVQAFGGKAGTAYGLAGLGALTERVFAADGYAFNAGLALAAGDLETARGSGELASLVARMATRTHKVQSLETPLVHAVAALFAGALDAATALAGLMALSAGAE